MSFRRFVEELLVDGELAHRLDCGHVRIPGLNRKSDGCPIARQWCAACYEEKKARERESSAPSPAS